MSLNIKNAATVGLVRELARRTGRSQTSAVELAVRAQLDALSASPPAANPYQILAELREMLTPDDRAAIRDEAVAIYDDAGLPR